MTTNQSGQGSTWTSENPPPDNIAIEGGHEAINQAQTAGAEDGAGVNGVGASTALGAITQAKKIYTDSEAVACSLENPEICDACQ